MVWAYSTWSCVRFWSLFSESRLARMSSELSGVRSSWLMLARNSDLYLETSASCLADEPLTDGEVVGDVLAARVAVGRQQAQSGCILVAGLVDEEGAEVRAHRRGQLAHDVLRQRLDAALALHHAAELGQVGLE